jgi:hypothetical protein
MALINGTARRASSAQRPQELTRFQGPPDKHETAILIVSRLVTDLKPGVCDAPLARLRGLTSATSREAGLHAVDGSFCPVTQGRTE